MFVARTKGNEIVSLLYQPVETILKLKQLSPFYCIYCNREVIIKMGKKTVPHFAHLATCDNEVKGESENHIRGKELLYEWLKNQNYEPQFEILLPTIMQRPDLLFSIKDQLIAVEFQSSIIQLSELIKRTNQFLHQEIKPIWVIDEKLLTKYGNILNLSDFQSFFLFSINGFPNLLSLNPTQETIKVYSNFMPFSLKRAYFNVLELSVQDSFTLIKNTQLLPVRNYDHWLHSCEKWLIHQSMQPKARINPFLQFLYNHKIHPLELPPEVGVPLSKCGWLKSPPFEWQAYLWVRFIYNHGKGYEVSQSEIRKYTFYHMKRHIKWRRGVDCNQSIQFQAILQYFDFLSEIGVLQKSKSHYVVIQQGKKIVYPNIYGKDMRKEFFRKYKGKIIETFRLTD